jgi:CubicO group peptidase (beta-lactamase class C family)
MGLAVAAGTTGVLGNLPDLPVPRPSPRPLPAAPVPVSALSLEEAARQASLFPRLTSLLVSVDGLLVVERYFHGLASGRTANLKSASKSIISALVGIAIDRGHIKGLLDPVSRYLPEHVTVDPAKAAITIEDLLTMRTGLETTSNRNYGRWVSSPNWLRFVFEQPLVDVPGGRMIYSTGSSHVLSAVLTRATGQSTFEFARTALAEPLGIVLPAWPRDPQGIYLGGNEMPMRPRDMVRVGELYLNGGRYDDRQVVSEAWVRASVVPRTMSRWGDREYGYGWWIRTLADVPTFYAWGYGGQFIFVIPSLRTVVVTTSVAEPGSERREHLDGIYGLVAREIIPVVGPAFPRP